MSPSAVTSRKLWNEHADHLGRYFWGDTHILWSRSYCIVSAGGAPLSIIRAYIENQDVGA